MGKLANFSHLIKFIRVPLKMFLNPKIFQRLEELYSPARPKGKLGRKKKDDPNKCRPK